MRVQFSWLLILVYAAVSVGGAGLHAFLPSGEQHAHTPCGVTCGDEHACHDAGSSEHDDSGFAPGLPSFGHSAGHDHAACGICQFLAQAQSPAMLAPAIERSDFVERAAPRAQCSAPTTIRVAYLSRGPPTFA